MRIALLLALVLLLAAAGCGSNGDSGDEQPPGNKPATTQKDEGYNYP
jgi:hypothetical protein